MATSIFDRAKGLLSRDERVATEKSPTVVVKKITQEFHAVSIQPGARCCHQARALQGQRFLSREAPSLPLKNCNCGSCTCHYEHHDDRRARPRRARDMGVAIDGWAEADQRVNKGRGRRKTDKSD